MNDSFNTKPEDNIATERPAPPQLDGPAGPAVRRSPIDWLEHLAPQPIPGVPWSLGRAMAILAAAIVVSLAFGLIIGGILVATGAGRFDLKHPLAWLLVALQIQEIAFLVPVPVLILWHYRASPRVLGLRPPVRWQLMVLGVAGAAAVLLSDQIIQLLFQAVAPGFLQSNVKETFGPIHHLSVPQGALLFLAVSVEVPLVEETLFRGIVYQGARRFFSERLSPQWTVFAAALLSGFLFGVVHLEPHTFPFLMAAGFIFAYLFEYTGSVYVSALAHGLGNAIAFIAWANSL